MNILWEVKMEDKYKCLSVCTEDRQEKTKISYTFPSTQRLKGNP